MAAAWGSDAALPWAWCGQQCGIELIMEPALVLAGAPAPVVDEEQVYCTLLTAAQLPKACPELPASPTRSSACVTAARRGRLPETAAAARHCRRPTIRAAG
jgi:hypothetical protein